LALGYVGSRLCHRRFIGYIKIYAQFCAKNGVMCGSPEEKGRLSASFVQNVDLCVDLLLLSHTQLHFLLTFALNFNICLHRTGPFFNTKSPGSYESGLCRSSLSLLSTKNQTNPTC
jgi:hypothetical protein